MLSSAKNAQYEVYNRNSCVVSFIYQGKKTTSNLVILLYDISDKFCLFLSLMMQKGTSITKKEAFLATIIVINHKKWSTPCEVISR